MLWLNVYEGCLLPTNILSSTSLVPATVPRCPGRGTFLPVSWPGGCGGKAGAGQSPPRRRSFPPNVATTGTRPPAHLATWGPAPGTSAPPPADTSTGAGLQGPRPVFITPCPVEKKSDVRYFWCFLSWSIIGYDLNQYKDRKDGSGEYHQFSHCNAVLILM